MNDTDRQTLTPDEKRARMRERFEHAEQRLAVYEETALKVDYTLEQLGYRVTWIDPAGRVWGIKVCKLFEQDMFISGMLEAIRRSATNDNVIAWALWFREYLCDYRGEHCGIKVKIRRLLGLHDYSLAKIIKATRNHIFLFRDIICCTTLGQGFTDFLRSCTNNIDRIKDSPEATLDKGGYSSLIGSMFVHKGVLPNEFMNLTQPQLNAINAYSDKESKKRRHGMSQEEREKAGWKRW